MAFKKRLANNNNNEYDNEGRISVWLSDRDTKYVASGSFTIDGEEYKVYLYENQYKGEDRRKPDYTGSVIKASEVQQGKKGGSQDNVREIRPSKPNTRREDNWSVPTKSDGYIVDDGRHAPEYIKEKGDNWTDDF